MMRFLVRSLALFVLAAPSLLHAAAPVDSTAVLARARELRPFVSRGESGPLWTVFDEPMRAAMGDSTRFSAMLTGIHAEVGEITKVLSEEITQDRGVWVYKARCEFSKSSDPLLLLVAFSPSGLVAGLAVRPEDRKEYPTTKLDYITRTALQLPFRGEWFVFWGGHTLAENHHAASKSQRFAYDLAITKNDVTHTGNGEKLTDYYCYGMEILAPAAGTVVWACDSLPDQTPGETDPASPVGNGVVIDHGNGEFSLLAHMQPKSVRVKVGARVKAGDVVGLCGNSGNTSEPHLHYHLQNGMDIRNAEGLPARFAHVCVDGKPVDNVELLKGQKIQNCAR